MMKFTIGKSLQHPNQNNSYAVEFEFMHGDGDHEEEVIKYFPINDAGEIVTHYTGMTFEDAVRLGQKMDILVDDADGDTEQMMELFLTIPGFSELLEDEYPGDMFTDYNNPASYTCFRIKFFNEHGTPFEVKVDG